MTLENIIIIAVIAILFLYGMVLVGKVVNTDA